MTDSILHAWHASGGDAALPSLETLRTRADAFTAKIRRRNRIEYGAAVLVVVIFSAYAAFLHSPGVRIGSLLVVLGTFVVVWQLNRRASAVAAPSEAGAMPILQHQRAQFVRQRDALATVAFWYLGPLVPGLLVMMFAPVFEHGLAGFAAIGIRGAIAIAINVVALTGIWWLNRRVAGKLQRAIDEIDGLTGEAG